MAEKTPEWKLDAFGWLPLAKWTPATILNFNEIESRRYCKICDKWIIRKRNESHIKWHVSEMRFILAQRRKAALEAAKAAKKFKAEERRLEREAMKSLGLK